MNCRECQGACCETITLPNFTGEGPSVEDARWWFRLHGTVREDGERVELEVACGELGPGGRCKIYHFRPEVCRDFPVGGEECLRAVRLRRSPEDYQRIRDEQDPPTL